MTEDPKEKETKWLTEGLPTVEKVLHLDRTRILFPGQLEWYHACLALEDEYFRARVEADMLMMMAYQGRRSDDVVETLSHLTDQDTVDSGLQPLKDYLAHERRKRRSGTP